MYVYVYVYVYYLGEWPEQSRREKPGPQISDGRSRAGKLPSSVRSVAVSGTGAVCSVHVAGSSASGARQCFARIGLLGVSVVSAAATVKTIDTWDASAVVL